MLGAKSESEAIFLLTNIFAFSIFGVQVREAVKNVLAEFVR